MTDRTAAHQKEAERLLRLAAVKEEQARAARKRRAFSLAAWAVGLVLVAGIITAGLLSSKPQDRTAGTPTPAPTFTLTDTTGDRVDLAAFRGRNVILYFSEGAGCQSCLLQMAQIEKQASRIRRGQHHGAADRDEHQGPDHRGHGRQQRPDPVPAR